MIKIKYTKQEKIRLDIFLANEMNNFTRSFVKKQINEGKVLLNNKRVEKPGIIIFFGDVVSFDEKVNNSSDELKPWFPKEKKFEIIYENNDYLILNKFSNLVVHPGNGNQEQTLVNILIGMKIKLAHEKSSRPGIIHRLDKNTTGILVIVKNDEFYEKLQEQFKKRKVTKKYIGIVNGNIEAKKGEIIAPIGRSRSDRKLNAIGEISAKEAITKFKVLKHFDKYDLVEFELITGRMHQIRVHCKYIKHPILNDSQYGTKILEENNHFLHSSSITFKNMDNKKVTYVAPLPKHFEKFINI